MSNTTEKKATEGSRLSKLDGTVAGGWDLNMKEIDNYNPT
jgi:hypothetical protein